MLITLIYLLITGLLRPTPVNYPLGLQTPKQARAAQPILKTIIFGVTKQIIRTS
jgi:hypothetical protein